MGQALKKNKKHQNKKPTTIPWITRAGERSQTLLWRIQQQQWRVLTVLSSFFYPYGEKPYHLFFICLLWLLSCRHLLVWVVYLMRGESSLLPPFVHLLSCVLRGLDQYQLVVWFLLPSPLFWGHCCPKHQNKTKAEVYHDKHTYPPSPSDKHNSREQPTKWTTPSHGKRDNNNTNNNK